MANSPKAPEPRPAAADKPVWMQAVVLVFGIVLVVALSLVAFLGLKSPTPIQLRVFNVAYALGVAAAASGLSGTLKFGKLGIAGTSTLGVLAMVFVYMANPAGLVRPQVDIQRVADFTKSGCDPKTGKTDLQVLTDTFRLVNYAGATYEGSADVNLDNHEDVVVYDLNADPDVPAPPSSEERFDRVIRKHWNLLVKDGVARGRYVWRNASPHDEEGLFFLSSRAIRDISASVLLPPGKSIEPTGYNPKDATGDCHHMRQTDSFECRNIGATPVTINWRWNMWQGCQTATGAAPQARLVQPE